MPASRPGAEPFTFDEISLPKCFPLGFWRDGHRTEIVPSWLRTRMSNSRSLRSRRATALHLTPDAAALGDQRPSMAAEAAGLPRGVGPAGFADIVLTRPNLPKPETSVNC